MNSEKLATADGGAPEKSTAPKTSTPAKSPKADKSPKPAFKVGDEVILRLVAQGPSMIQRLAKVTAYDKSKRLYSVKCSEGKTWDRMAALAPDARLRAPGIKRMPVAEKPKASKK